MSVGMITVGAVEPSVEVCIVESETTVVSVFDPLVTGVALLPAPFIHIFF